MYHTQICANEEVKNVGKVLRVVIIKPLCNTTGGRVPGFHSDVSSLASETPVPDPDIEGRQVLLLGNSY